MIGSETLDSKWICAKVMIGGEEVKGIKSLIFNPHNASCNLIKSIERRGKIKIKVNKFFKKRMAK